MNHSLEKGPFVDEYLMRRVEIQTRAEKKKAIRTWSRHSTVLLGFIGCTITVYDGRRHVPVYIREDIVGHKLGEFASARACRGHAADDKKTKR